jgi:transcriptional regulator with XRE-family HTH domain
VVGLFTAGRCRIPEILRQRGMTQRQLADLTGINYTYINDRANNRDGYILGLNNAKTIAESLGCNIDDLYEWKRECDKR